MDKLISGALVKSMSRGYDPKAKCLWGFQNQNSQRPPCKEKRKADSKWYNIQSEHQLI